MRPPKKTIYQIQDTDNEITQLRKKACLTQEALASVIGMAVSTIRRWEKGECEPTMQVWQMKAFCEAVHVKFDQLPPLLARLKNHNPSYMLRQSSYSKRHQKT